jgi:predicted GNAT family acetyltransferase
MELAIKDLEIRQDKEKECFYFVEEEAKDAQLQYKLHSNTNPHTVEFVHTYVPVALRETGLGTKLAEKGIRWAMDQGYQIKPSCPFVKNYMESREDYRQLIS